MSWTDTSILVDRAKAGDREAFGELVTQFQSHVYHLALGMVRNHTEAQELAQDVFIHAMRKLPQLRESRAFAGWLRQITSRMAINRINRRGPTFGTEPEVLDAVAGVNRPPEQELELNEAKAELHAGLKQLKADDRATLEAFYLRGQDLKQMAESFDAPIGTIKRRLHVARHRLKAVMEANAPSEDTVEVRETPPKRKKCPELMAAV